MEEIILSTQGLRVDYTIRKHLFTPDEKLLAVDSADITIRRGEIYGLVGESGCGKTTLANAILGFVPMTGGSFTFMGETIDKNSSRKTWEGVRRSMQTIFQDPYTSLNPRLTVWQIISEPLYIEGERDERVLKERVAAILEKVGLNLDDIDRHVFEFSGGQRQRIAIARALISGAKFIVCDEPTAALDVSVQSQICNLLLDLQQELELTYLFISHNLSLIKHITGHMSVMYLGKILESGATDEIFENPACPYTEALISAILEVKPKTERRQIILRGEAKSQINPGETCRFAGRCPKKCPGCDTEPMPALTSIGREHLTACRLGIDNFNERNAK